MAKSTTVTIADHQLGFIEAQVAEGHYGSASAVVQTGLRLLEEQEAQLAQLREVLIEGEESGPARPFDSAAFLQRMHDEYARGK